MYKFREKNPTPYSRPLFPFLSHNIRYRIFVSLNTETPNSINATSEFQNGLKRFTTCIFFFICLKQDPSIVEPGSGLELKHCLNFQIQFRYQQWIVQIGVGLCVKQFRNVFRKYITPRSTNQDMAANGIFFIISIVILFLLDICF